MTRKNIAFPQVLKNAELGGCVIIYWNRAEYFGGVHAGCDVVRAADQHGDGREFDPFEEIDMCTGNGYRFVHPARDNFKEQDARISELEAEIQNMRENCPEGGCLVEVA